MRYCIFSDVHGNLEALQAVMDAFTKDRIDKYIYLGDIVGYGADPGACISGLQSLGPDHLIAGNHEWGVLDLLGIDYFSEYARSAVEWTKGVLNAKELEYLKSFRLICHAPGLTAVHGSLDQPDKFQYIYDPSDALRTLQISDTPLCFVGHTHRAGIYVSESGEVKAAGGSKVFIQRRNKYIINAGSVGQPRDGDPRAAYAIYDGEEGTVEIKRVRYNIEAAQDKIRSSGLPVWLASRLAEGR